MIKAIFLALLMLDYGYKLLRLFLNARQGKLPLPEAVRDICEPERYHTRSEYERDCRKLYLVQITLRFVVMLVLYATNLWTRLYFLLTVLSERQEYLLICSYLLLITLIEAPFHYIRQFKIEEKYGMNRCSIRTFVIDCLRALVLNAVFHCCLCMGYMSTFYTWGNFVGRTSGGLLIGFLVGGLLSNVLPPLGNKLTPLEEGPLRDKLSELFANEGFRMKQIYVMDASRRTTRVNAYCMGMGRRKRIVLYDNLVHNYTEDEIIAVFAHELSHYKNHDTLKLFLLSMVYFFSLNLLVGALLFMPFPLSDSYGILGFSPAFALLTVLSADVMGPVKLLLNAGKNAFSRPMETRADAMAAAYGYGEGQISFLRKHVQRDLVPLQLHPIIIALEYSHPPIHKRIKDIRAFDKAGSVATTKH